MPKHPIYTYIKQLSIVHLKFRFPWDILHFIWQPYQGTVLSWTNSLVPLGGRTCPGRVSGPGKLSALGLLVPTAPGFGRGPPPIPSPITNVDDRKSQSDMEFQIILHSPCLHIPCLWVSCPWGSHLQIQRCVISMGLTSANSTNVKF